VLAAAVAAACSAPGTVGRLRFQNQSPAWKVDDRRDIPKPTARPFPEKLYFFDAVFFRRLTNAMEFPEPRRAANVNSLGEVPDSTWFTNRVGVRDLALAEMARGPNVDDGPDPSGPWRVKGSKVGGGSVGILVEDARKKRFIFKFDEPEYPVMETATDVIVQRLLWASGFNVPENTIVFFKRDKLILDENAKVKDVFGNARRMTVADLDDALGRVNVAEDGTYRALASKYLAGVPVGGFAQAGRRADDPNDVVPHEHRREIRGLYVFFAWLQQTDAKEDNTLDMWIEDQGRHYVKHYLVDFGKSLGTSAYIVKRPGDGHVENVDWEFIFKGLLSVGLWKRTFEGVDKPDLVGVGVFDWKHYAPGAWKSHAPYTPFHYADPYDMFWAAKIIIRFTPDQIRAAVEQGKIGSERSEAFLVESLIQRQRMTARYWFERVNPLDRFRIDRTGDGYRICFDDLLLAYGLEPGAGAVTSYLARSFDFGGHALSWTKTAAAGREQGRTACVSGFELAADHDGYTIIRIDTRRGRDTLSPVEVHVARDRAGQPRIIGLNRR